MKSLPCCWDKHLFCDTSNLAIPSYYTKDKIKDSDFLGVTSGQESGVHNTNVLIHFSRGGKACSSTHKKSTNAQLWYKKASSWIFQFSVAAFVEAVDSTIRIDWALLVLFSKQPQRKVGKCLQGYSKNYIHGRGNKATGNITITSETTYSIISYKFCDQSFEPTRNPKSEPSVS